MCEARHIDSYQTQIDTNNSYLSFNHKNEIFLFVMSNEISVTLKQIYVGHQISRKLVCTFQTEK